MISRMEAHFDLSGSFHFIFHCSFHKLSFPLNKNLSFVPSYFWVKPGWDRDWNGLDQNVAYEFGVGNKDTYLSIVLIATIVDNIRTYSKKY